MSARQRLQRSVWAALLALLATAALVAGVDAGARMLGPVLIVVAALSGTRAVRAWWLGREERWFAAEVVLVASGWALFAAAFSGIQYLSFSLMPGAFFVDADYGKLASPRYRAEWLRDSSRAGGMLVELETAMRWLSSEEPATLALDTVYPLPGGATVMVREQCDVMVSAERCAWRLVVSPGRGEKATELLIAAPEEGHRSIARKALERAIAQETEPLRRETVLLGRRLADPAAFVQPRIGDFLYDTAIAFSGRDSGVFVPISALARAFKVLESLASYLLFGIVVSRAATAAGSRNELSSFVPRSASEEIP